jgi:PPP family 3-phenylpropionic acid transporter
LSRARLASVYFAYYAGVGVSMAYLAPYLRGLGFSGKQIGGIAFAQQLVAATAALAWGGLGDRIGVRALRFAAAGAVCAVAFLPSARTPFEAGLALAAMSAFSGGIVPLVDATTVKAAGAGYGRVRLWGSVGFVCTAWGVGLFLTARGDRPGDSAMPFAYLGCYGAVAAAALSLRAGEEPQGGGEAALRRLSEGFALLRDPGLLLVFCGCALHWAANVPYNLFFGVLVREHGFSSRVTGLGMALGVAAEVVALFAFPALVRRFSLRALFAAVYLVSALRWLLVSRATSAAELAILQLLHAATFGVWWGCAVESLRLAVPHRLRASGQAVFSALVFGAGNLAGSIGSGLAYDRFGGAAPLFIGAAAVEILALVPSVRWQRALPTIRSRT